jgi:hypothetical protein
MATLDTLGSIPPEAYIAVGLLAVEIARRVVSFTPGKADDEIVSKVEKILRHAADFFAGQHTNRDDPGMIKTKPKEKS